MDKIEFGPYRLVGPQGPLWKDGTTVALPPKELAVLWELVTHAGQIVSKEALFTAVWGETIVSEGALTVCVRRLRHALGEDAAQPRYIATVHRIGYRFIAEAQSPKSKVQGQGEASQKSKVKDQKSKIFPTQSSALSPQHSVPVGRKAELMQLHSLFARALDGERQMVFVSGEAGIGKTTLIDAFLGGFRSWELGSSTSPLQTPDPKSQIPSPGAWVAWGQCIEHYGVGEAYLPVLEALGRLGRQPGGERLTAILNEHAPTWLAQLPTLLSPTELEAGQRRVQGATRERMLRELAEALDVVSAEHPLVLVLEDLHWGDPSTVELLAALARRRDAARLLVLGTYRPVELVVTNHPLKAVKHELVARGQGTELLLGNLSREAVQTYVTRRLGQPARQEEMAVFVHQRTEGHALFMVQVTDYLLQQEAGEVLTPAAKRRVPDGLQQLIELQLARLGAEAQQVLAVASVVGAEFAAASVAAGLREKVETIEARCEELAREGQFIEDRGAMTWPDGTVSERYGFRHALYQEVLYTRIPEARRVRLHRVIGERLEHAHGEQAREIAAELAMHFEQGRDPRRAVHYLSLAVKTDLERNAYQEAGTLLTRALEVLKLWPDTPERIQQELSLQLRFATVLMATKGYASAEVEDAFARTRLLCQQAGNTEYLLPALRGLWAFDFIRGDIHTAYALARQALALAQGQADSVLLLEAHQSLGHTLSIQGELIPAQEQLHRSMSMYEPKKCDVHIAMYGRDPKVVSLLYEALILRLSGYAIRALQCCDAARAHAEEIQHPLSRLFALMYTARTYQFLREVRATHEWTQAAIALASEYGFQDWKRRTETLLDWTRMARAAGEESMLLFQQGEWAKRAVALGSGVTYEYALIAEAYGRLGHPKSGLEMVQAGLAIVDKRGERFYEAELWRVKGALLLTQEIKRQKAKGKNQKSEIPDTQHLVPSPQAEMEREAEGYFLKAITIARRQQAKSLELRAVTGLARLWQRQGKAAEAHQVLSEIYGWFTEGFDTADLREAKAVLDRFAQEDERQFQRL